MKIELSPEQAKRIRAESKRLMKIEEDNMIRGQVEKKGEITYSDKSSGEIPKKKYMGTVRHNDLEGGFLELVTDKGEIYRLDNYIVIL